ncbi:unnamed protein product [Pedinophyceae sp. YPF-701]|nr:unnamed protein product [Pedinophyceae sp. YPF-701]
MVFTEPLFGSIIGIKRRLSEALLTACRRVSLTVNTLLAVLCAALTLYSGSAYLTLVETCEAHEPGTKCPQPWFLIGLMGVSVLGLVTVVTAIIGASKQHATTISASVFGIVTCFVLQAALIIAILSTKMPTDDAKIIIDAAKRDRLTTNIAGMVLFVLEATSVVTALVLEAAYAPGDDEDAAADEETRPLRRSSMESA